MSQPTSWWFLGMHLFWWAFWMLLIIATFTSMTPIPRTLLRSGTRALDILNRRYAAGQVSTDEYERRRAILQRGESTATQSSSTRHS